MKIFMNFISLVLFLLLSRNSQSLSEDDVQPNSRLVLDSPDAIGLDSPEHVDVKPVVELTSHNPSSNKDEIPQPLPDDDSIQTESKIAKVVEASPDTIEIEASPDTIEIEASPDTIEIEASPDTIEIEMPVESQAKKDEALDSSPSSGLSSTEAKLILSEEVAMSSQSEVHSTESVEAKHDQELATTESQSMKDETASPDSDSTLTEPEVNLPETKDLPNPETEQSDANDNDPGAKDDILPWSTNAESEVDLPETNDTAKLESSELEETPTEPNLEATNAQVEEDGFMEVAPIEPEIKSFPVFPHFPALTSVNRKPRPNPPKVPETNPESSVKSSSSSLGVVDVIPIDPEIKIGPVFPELPPLTPVIPESKPNLAKAHGVEPESSVESSNAAMTSSNPKVVEEQDEEKARVLAESYSSFQGFKSLDQLREESEFFENAYVYYMTRVCQDRKPSEMFRIHKLIPENCHRVARCNLVKGNYTLERITCKFGTLFDVDSQKCQEISTVLNCDIPWSGYERDDEELITEEEAEILIIDYSRREPLHSRAPRQSTGAYRCTPEACQSPKCYCSADGSGIPGGLKVSQTPQLISINFQESVTIEELNTFNTIFTRDRKNPNGCSIKGTWFASHKYTSNVGLERYYGSGHEVASYSITRTDSSYYWTWPNQDTYKDEFVGSREIFEKFSFIPQNEIVGIRVPFLYLGGEPQFKMMEENDFLYDSTVVVQYNSNEDPVWPYNVKYGLPHECHSLFKGNCPNFEKEYDVWELPLNEFPNIKLGYANCPLLSSCTFRSKEQFRELLDRQFNRHYSSNRAPIMLGTQAGFFRSMAPLGLFEVFLEWLDEILDKHDDVYFVTNKQIISWIKDPTPLDRMKDFAPFKGEKCNPPLRVRTTCGRRRVCALPTIQEDFYMFTCQTCPKYYPWLGNTHGTKEWDFYQTF